MSVERDAVLIRPLFYDALSGLFKPMTDTLEREHTLGRLGYATVQRGDEVTEGYDDELHCFQYTPSWAPKVVSFVLCGADLETGQLTLNYLALSSSESPSGDLAVVHTTRRNHQQLVLTDWNKERTFDLELGDSLALLQKDLSQRAGDFFDQTAE